MDPHVTQNMSTTVCHPVIIIRSSFSPTVTFTLSLHGLKRCYLQESSYKTKFKGGIEFLMPSNSSNCTIGT